MKPPNAVAPAGSFYDQWTALRDAPNLSPGKRAAAQAQLVEAWLPSSKAMGVSLQAHPKEAILPTPLGTIVSKFADTSEVFERDDVFAVAPGYGERMAISTGSFMLGMDAGAVYDRENSLIRLAMPVSDLTVIRRWVRNYAEGWVGQIAAKGSTIDVVQDVGYRVPIGFVGHYFGVPGPSDAVWIGWLQILGLYIFNFWAGGSPFKEAASAAGLEYQDYINDTIRERGTAIAAGQEVPDDVLTRMIVKAGADPANNLDQIAMRRNLGGLSIGSIMPPSGNIIFALDVIIGLRETDRATFDTIVRAARDDDEELLRSCMLEAGRLGAATVPPTLFRVAQSDYTLARGTDRATLIPEGTTVILVPPAATMDPDAIDQPQRFRIDRPDHDYMGFGQGMHECTGRAIGEVLLTEAARAVLRLPNLRRAEGPVGQLSDGEGLPAGSYPAHMVFAFDGPVAG